MSRVINHGLDEDPTTDQSWILDIEKHKAHKQKANEALKCAKMVVDNWQSLDRIPAQNMTVIESLAKLINQHVIDADVLHVMTTAAGQLNPHTTDVSDLKVRSAVFALENLRKRARIVADVQNVRNARPNISNKELAERLKTGQLSITVFDKENKTMILRDNSRLITQQDGQLPKHENINESHTNSSDQAEAVEPDDMQRRKTLPLTSIQGQGSKEPSGARRYTIGAATPVAADANEGKRQNQAAKGLGRVVDKIAHICRLRSCEDTIWDTGRTTFACPSCGPRSQVRYCCLDHLLQDIPRHFQECGSDAFLISKIIDPSTMTTNLKAMIPTIQDINGIPPTFELHRQKIYAAFFGGQYTLFDPVDGSDTVLTWPTTDPRHTEMSSRVERVLNYAFFDHRNEQVLVYLFRLIIHVLAMKPSGTNHGVTTVLQRQFRAEFGVDFTPAINEPLCECEWLGDDIERVQHSNKDCCFPRDGTFTGLKKGLEDAEAQHWILRANRTRHYVKDWRVRAQGVGFPEAIQMPSWWAVAAGQGHLG